MTPPRPIRKNPKSKARNYNQIRNVPEKTVGTFISSPIIIFTSKIRFFRWTLALFQENNFTDFVLHKKKLSLYYEHKFITIGIIIMPRPCKIRCINGQPASVLYKPAGIPAANLQWIQLNLDEFESIRLIDHLGLEQEQTAEKMGVSRPTVTRIYASARKKIADVLVLGQALRIEGGVVEMAKRQFQCSDCNHQWPEAFGTGHPDRCPECQSTNLHRIVQDTSCKRAGQTNRKRRICRRKSL